MQKKKVLFTGGSGLLAVNWALSICNDFEVVLGLHERNISVPGISCVLLNIEQMDDLINDLQSIRPDIVIHCAGLANVELCESNPELAYKINVALSEITAKCCKQLGIRFVYISTDHLFSGAASMMREDAPQSPVNVYAKTKGAAEKIVLSIIGDSLVIRTNFYGWGTSYRRSFSDMVIDNLRVGKTVSLFNDFFHTPILIEELAKIVMLLLEKDAFGIFHVVGSERISKYDLGVRLAKKFSLPESLILPTKFSERKDLIRRPVDLSLSNSKSIDFLDRSFGVVDANILRLYEQEQNGFSKIIRSI